MFSTPEESSEAGFISLIKTFKKVDLRIPFASNTAKISPVTYL